jgi:hypothetical protein
MFVGHFALLNPDPDSQHCFKNIFCLEKQIKTETSYGHIICLF